MKMELQTSVNRRQATIFVAAAALLSIAFCDLSPPAAAGPIVVAHDVNTWSSTGANEQTFAVNVASFLTANRPQKRILWFDSNTSGAHHLSPVIANAVTTAGFTLTVTNDYSTPFSSATYDAIFVAAKTNNPGSGSIPSTTDLANFVNSSGGLYVAGGVGSVGGAAGEAAAWAPLLNPFGIDFESSGFNGVNNVPITGTHPIFNGVTSLVSGNGQYVNDLMTNPNASIVQDINGNGVYAVVEAQTTPVPEPTSLAIWSLLGVAGAGYRWRRKKVGQARRDVRKMPGTA